MEKLLIGTNNPAKLHELTNLLKPLDIACMTLKEAGIIDEASENASTIEENSLIKADFYWEQAHLPVMTDDTAFEIDALNGQPGVHIRRWLGHRMTDEEIRQEILRRIAGFPEDKCGAQLRSVVTLRINADKYFQAEGITRGVVQPSELPITEEGFPIEPIFWLNKQNKFYGQCTATEREEIGSRAIAVKKLIPQLQHRI